MKTRNEDRQVADDRLHMDAKYSVMRRQKFSHPPPTANLVEWKFFLNVVLSD